MSKIKEKEVCYHCGEDCEDEVILDGEKKFCCNGCHTVYLLLDENNLNNYYNLNNKPGVQQKSRSSKEKLAYLDDAVIREKLIDFSDGNITKISFYLPQVHCSSCVWLLEKLPQLHHGVANAKVNFLKKEVYVNFYEEKLSLRALVELLINLGYEPLINLEDLDKKKKQRKSATQTKAFFIKLGITGFCFGNIMMLSFPEYLGIDEMDRAFIDLFGYLNLVLSLPVFFYGANDYLLSAWAALKHKTVNIDVPISLGILALFSRSIYEILFQVGAGYLDSLSALIFLLLIGKWFQQKTFDNISFERDYKSYFPIAVTTVKDGKEETIPISNLKEGDILSIRNGELIPSDAVLLEGEAHIDYSFVTGESKPVPKKTGDFIYAGGKQKGGIIRLKMVKEVSQSYLTRLWNDSAFQQEKAHNLNDKTNVIGKYFTFVVLFIAFGSAFYWWGEGIEKAVNTFTAVLIIACPCALALNVPFTLGNALRFLAKSGLYVKDTQVIEGFPDINHFVFDKTGTITSADKEAVSFEGDSLTEQETEWVAELVRHSTHPVSQQISGYLNGKTQSKVVGSFKEYEGQGIEANINGKILRLGKLSFVQEDSQKQIKKEFQTVAHLSIDKAYRGKFVLKQNLRKGIEPLIENLSDKNQLSLLSGDNETEKERLSKIFTSSSDLRFNQSPEDKMNYIKGLQKDSQKVAMIGDGLNDAGALKQANIGIAVAENVHQFSPACDAILNAKQMAKFKTFFDFGKACMNVVYIGFALSFLYNIVGLYFAVQGDLSPIVAAILMPLSSVTVVGFGMLATTFLSRKL